MDRQDYTVLIYAGILAAVLIGLWALYAGVILFVHLLVWILPKLVVILIIVFILKYFKLIKI